VSAAVAMVPSLVTSLIPEVEAALKGKANSGSRCREACWYTLLRFVSWIRDAQGLAKLQVSIAV
jgi:hypothetical protein